LRSLILVAREEFLKDKCGPRAKKFEHHCCKWMGRDLWLTLHCSTIWGLTPQGLKTLFV